MDGGVEFPCMLACLERCLLNLVEQPLPRYKTGNRLAK